MMHDKEKVIKHFEHLLNAAKGNYQEFVDLTVDAGEEILVMLKEHDAVKPKYKERMGGFVAGICPTCGTALNNVFNVKACGKCGQEVKWE